MVAGGSRSAPTVTVPPHTRRRRPSQIRLAYILVIAEQIVFHVRLFNNQLKWFIEWGLFCDGLRRRYASTAYPGVRYATPGYHM